jgi:hypothetical protein
MREPQAVPLKMYRRVVDHAPIEWPWVEQRLTDALFYTLVTASADGVPCTRVVWGMWFEGRLLLTVGGPIHWRNVKENRNVNVTVGDGLEVILVEGTARAETDVELQERFLALYNPKYHYDLKAPTTMFAVEPSVVFAWTETGHAGSGGFVSSGKWVFAS